MLFMSAPFIGVPVFVIVMSGNPSARDAAGEAGAEGMLAVMLPFVPLDPEHHAAVRIGDGATTAMVGS